MKLLPAGNTLGNNLFNVSNTESCIAMRTVDQVHLFTNLQQRMSAWMGGL